MVSGCSSLRGVGTGYLLAAHRLQSGAVSGSASGEAPDGLYKDEEVSAMRNKLLTLSLPISSDDAFQMLGIDRTRLGQPEFHGWGNDGNQVSLFTWRLSPTFGIAMYEEQGPDFGPRPVGNKKVTHIAIGKSVPAPGSPPGLKLVVLDETDKEQTEIRLPLMGKGARLAYWRYPNVSRTVRGYEDADGVTGGFACPDRRRLRQSRRLLLRKVRRR